MWSIGNPIVNTVTSLFSMLAPSRSIQQERLDRYKWMYDDVIHIVNEMREHGEETKQDWISSTNILQDLNQMVDILVEEEKDLQQKGKSNDETNDTSPLCRDYLLNYQIVDGLCGIAMVDDPKGSTEIIVQHLTRLFREVQFPLLSNGTIGVSVSALFQKLIQFYHSASVSSSLEVSIVKLVEIVCEKLCDDPVLLNSFFSYNDNSSPLPSPSPKAINVSFPLVEPLIPHINDSSSLGTTARKVLLLLIGNPHSGITEYLAYNTPVVKFIAQNLVEAVLQLLETNGRMEASLDLPEDVFKQRLLFVSEILQLCRNTQEFKSDEETAMVLYASLLKEIETELLKGYLEVELMCIKNDRIITATHILRMMLAFLADSFDVPLTDLIVRFIFTSNPLLLNSLLSRINNNSNMVSIVTLQLFDRLLKTQHPLVLKVLLPEVHMETVITPGDYIDVFASQFKEPLPSMDVIMKSNQNGVNGAMMQDVEYEMMMTKEVKSQVEFDMNSQSEMVIENHLSFIKILLSRVRMFLRQSMEVNLEVTQIITTISMIASPSVFCTLFLTDNSSSFTREFTIIWGKAIQRSKELINFERYLKVTETNLNMCDKSLGIQREDRLSVDATFRQYLEGYVVLREFLIELTYSIRMRSVVENI